MRFALDVMGGDHGPTPNVAAALRALQADPDLSLRLVGQQSVIEPMLNGTDFGDRLQIVHSEGVVGMDEKPSEALRRKPDNSISKSWQLLASQEVDGLISAGNTGAVVAGGLFLKRFLPGVKRPGIATLMPTAKGRSVILDVGANVVPKPEHLFQYGIMGSVLAQHLLGIDQPTIGLVNVGEEQGKGNELVQKAYELFRNGPFNDRFHGNVEGRDVHRGTCDVIVSDGFVGNVLLKHAEGLFEFIMGMVAKEIVAPLPNDSAMAANAVKQLVGKFHHSAAGGAPLLGIDGICIICHGSSDENAITNAIKLASQHHKAGVNQKIVEQINQAEA